MYHLIFIENFKRKLLSCIRKDKKLERKIEKTLDLLAHDPFYSSLKTHKANTVLYGQRYSSMVTGDLRIIWDYRKGEIKVLDILDIGGHSGKGKVYK